MKLIDATTNWLGSFRRNLREVSTMPGNQSPDMGELTKRQSDGAVSASFGALQSFVVPPAGTYATYRLMSSHPTLAMAEAVTKGPIIAGAWSYEARKDAKQEWKDFVEEQMNRLRPAIMEALLSLRYGWQPFEKVWKPEGGRVVLDKLKALLPDKTTILVTPNGQFAGLEQGDQQLPPVKVFVAANDVQAGNWYGRSRHENCRREWSNWMQIEQRSGQLATKVSSIIAQIHYPIGTSKDATGRVISNFEAAQSIAAMMASGSTVSIPNMYADSDDPRTAADLAGKSAWVISFLESGGAAQAMSGLTDRQKYYDTLMVRGWLKPERAITEAQTAGSRADSETAGDFVVQDCQQIDRDLARLVSWYIVDDLLAINFGEDARGAVWVVANPLIDEKRKVFAKIADAVLADPLTRDQLFAEVQMKAVFDALEYPLKDGAKVDFSDMLREPEPKEEKPLPPGADEQLKNDYANAGNETTRQPD